MTDVMICVDPHKGSHTAVAVDAAETTLGQIRVIARGDQLIAHHANCNQNCSHSVLDELSSSVQRGGCPELFPGAETLAGVPHCSTDQEAGRVAETDTATTARVQSLSITATS